MSFTGGDKAELNPKYIGKLIETRLYAINEKKHHDGVILTFYCPKCSHNNTVMKPLIFHNLTMDTFMQAVSGYRLETHTCVCGARLSSNNIIIALYSHYFPETQLDFQAEVTAGSEFVNFYRMDNAGDRALIRGTPDFRFMYETFGRVMSAREAWKYAVSTALQTRNIQLFNVEKGYVIVAMPGNNPRARVNMREIVGPDWPGDAALVFRLSDYKKEESPYDDAYTVWMPEYAADIAAGRVDAAAIVDQARIAALIERALARDGLAFTAHGDMIVVNRKPFKATLSVREIAKEAAFTARSFQDIIEAKLDFAMNRIYSAENLLAAIRRDMPSYTYAIDGDYLEITNPNNGLSDRVNIYAPLPRNGTKLIVSRLRESLCKDEKSRPVCRCGKPCFVFKSIQPSAWLKETPDAFNHVYDEKDNAVVLYYITCGEHAAPVMKTDLASWLVDRSALDDIFEEDLDVLRLNIEAHAGKFGKDTIIGVISNKACDIMTHPSFVAGLVDTLKAGIGPRVIVYAPLKELVLVYTEDADVENLNAAAQDLQTIAASRDVGQTPLDYIELFELDRPRGIFNLITLPPKPAPPETPPAAPGTKPGTP
ncbi:MAG: hypothetical protein A4E28_00730 [Methanocella sp. PtaU1.Bin125]|nr:MAG: hypothetical protein A4E28_00730 [Methanocella sp. PtaU1.Bin125]